MVEITSLDDALGVFKGEIDEGLRIETKEIGRKKKVDLYEAEFYSGSERYGVLIVALSNGVLDSAAYSGKHPLRTTHDVRLILNRMDSELPPEERSSPPTYGRFDSNPCKFLDLPQKDPEAMPREDGAANKYLHHKFEMESVL